MQSEDRIIHFSAELIHSPAPLQKEVLQRLYYELTQTRAAYDNTDFTNPMQWRFHSRRGQRTQSVCIFLPDRVLLVEEWVDIPMSSFLEKVEEVGRRVLTLRNQPHFLAHAATIRTTFALTHFDDARTFLLDHVCQQKGKITPHFGRPIATGGLRFVLPETNEHPGTYNLLVESYRHSRNEVFVEAKGVFTRQRVAPGELHLVLDNIRGVQHFITERIHPFLNQYDLPQQSAPEA